MLDIIDLMNEHYEPNLYDIDARIIEINLKNEFGDHDFSSTLDRKQFDILKENVARLHKLLTEQNEGSQHASFKQKVG